MMKFITDSRLSCMCSKCGIIECAKLVHGWITRSNCYVYLSQPKHLFYFFKVVLYPILKSTMVELISIIYSCNMAYAVKFIGY